MMTKEELRELCTQLYDEVNELIDMVHWLNCKLEDTISEPFSAIKERMVNLIKEGRFIMAVKMYKESYKSSLVEAKNIADELRISIYHGQYGDFDRELFEKNYGFTVAKIKGVIE
jgi:ribosomal protein L7/L12